jgi:glycosyltransferase involved in cell wall biosynthesis
VFGAPRRRASRLPQAVTSVSHRVLDRLTAAGAFGREGQQLRVIRGNNPHGALPPAPEPARGGVLRLGYIGRLDPSKGLSNLLDAVARLPPGAARLLIAGSGPPAYVAALRRIAPQDVEFLGQVEAALFYPRIDLLVVPSVWEDPFPRVFHEALAYGVPTLTTPLGGLPEAIEPGGTGFVAVAADAEALYRVLQTVADGGWDQAAMRAACRREAAAYAPERIVDQYEAVLSATAEGREVPDDAGEAWPRRMVASPTPSRSREAAQ